MHQYPCSQQCEVTCLFHLVYTNNIGNISLYLLVFYFCIIDFITPLILEILLLFISDIFIFILTSIKEKISPFIYL